MSKQHFKMERIHWVKKLLREGAAKRRRLDVLKDAYMYLSVAIAEHCRKFLLFVWEVITYEFSCLPFGLCSAPRIFTKLLRPVMAHLRFMGLRMIVYLGDILLIAGDQETLLKQTQQSITLLEQLSFTVNKLKLIIVPCHQITYLGLQVDSTLMNSSYQKKRKKRCNKLWVTAGRCWQREPSQHRNWHL